MILSEKTPRLTLPNSILTGEATYSTTLPATDNAIPAAISRTNHVPIPSDDAARAMASRIPVVPVISSVGINMVMAMEPKM
ncbi:hypothetical protein SDC9_107506 [bioreactor metagenome]|uniref:Uncharacterized protein n=1 Tax=bioreactor metagenome TaxID=1076179 RepID=A0A645BG05_9ZZZZ